MAWIDQFPRVEGDYGQLDRVLRRQTPDRVPVIEMAADRGFIREVLGHGPEAIAPDRDLADWQRFWLWRIEYQRVAWPDFLAVPLEGLTYPTRNVQFAANTAELADEDRKWVNESEGVIGSRADFDAYPWPEDPFDPARIDFVAENVPPGMGLIANSAGILEWTMWLMGYEPLAISLYEDPELVRDVTTRIGERFVAFYHETARHPAVRAMWLNDDLGFKTSTMLSPQHLREYIFPWHKKLAAIAHAQGKPFLLHACGNCEAVIDDLIDDVGIDAKHSFEDVIEPVTSFHQRFGQRVAVLGGMDIDFLARRSPDEIRRRTREILETCAPTGGYALGSGNSVTNYIPVPNYLAMLDELQRFNRGAR